MFIEYDKKSGRIVWRYSGITRPANLPNEDSGTNITESNLSVDDIKAKQSEATPDDDENAFLIYNPDSDSLAIGYEVVE